MRLAIVGSRNFGDQDVFDIQIANVIDLWGYHDEVVSGGSRGADSLGENWARIRNIPVMIYKPEWDKYGKSAGPIRNKYIIERSTHVLAFPSHAGKGTQHSITLAQKTNKELVIHWVD